MVNSIKRNIAGVEETYTCEYQGMCTTCGEAITLVIGSDRANNLNKTRYYFTSENETLADETIYAQFMATLSVLDSFTLSQKDNVLILDVEIGVHKKSFTGAMPELDIMMVSLGNWLAQLPKSIWEGI